MVSCRCSLLWFDKHATATREANIRGGWAQGVPELSRARTVDEVLPYPQGANVGSRVEKKKNLSYDNGSQPQDISTYKAYLWY